MIEKFINNPQTKKRVARFKSRKRSVIALQVFFFLIFISFTAEIWSNSKPIIMSYNGGLYIPIYQSYHPTEFNQTESVVTDYRALDFSGDNWALWPLIKWNPYETNQELASYPGEPSGANIFGTDDRGRDVLSRLLYGFRYSFGFALLVWLASYSMGIVMGSFMGFFGGVTDLVGQRLVEIFEAMPFLLIAITLVATFGANLWLLVIVATVFGWMGISIYTRAEFLRLRKMEFVEGARSIGSGRMRQIFKHILPNSLGPVVTFSPFSIAGGISFLAILDYLGLGMPPPTPSWGELLQQAEKNFTIAWWLAVFPSLALFVSLLVMNLIGEGARDAFDPRKSVD